ncbi:hypothetical protein BH11BAC3_BH11BAC3_08460 [soil metagenome]
MAGSMTEEAYVDFCAATNEECYNAIKNIVGLNARSQ